MSSYIAAPHYSSKVVYGVVASNIFHPLPRPHRLLFIGGSDG